MKETGEFSFDENELSPLNSPLPQKIFLKQDITFVKQSFIPKLDLSSAKKIQEANAKRINQPNNQEKLSTNEQIEKIQKYWFKLKYLYLFFN